MKKNYTDDDLILFLYKELPLPQSADLSAMLQDGSNWQLRESFQELQLGKKQLPCATFAPAQKSLDAILKHSEHSTLAANC